MALKHGGKLLSGVLKCKAAMMSLTKKIFMLDKLHSSMSCGAVGHEFNVFESTICNISYY